MNCPFTNYQLDCGLTGKGGLVLARSLVQNTSLRSALPFSQITIEMIRFQNLLSNPIVLLNDDVKFEKWAAVLNDFALKTGNEDLKGKEYNRANQKQSYWNVN